MSVLRPFGAANADSTYRGPDRRALVLAEAPVFDRVWVAGTAAVLLALGTGVVALEHALRQRPSVAAPAVALVACVLALVLAASCSVARRVTGSAAALRIGVGAMMLAAALLADAAGIVALGILRTAELELATILFGAAALVVVAAVRSPDVEVAPRWLGLRHLLIAIVGAGAVEMLLGWPFGEEEHGGFAGTMAGLSGLANLWAAAAAGVRARRDHHVFAGWLVLPLLLLGAAGMARAAGQLGAGDATTWLIRSHALTALSLAAALAAVLLAIHHAFRTQDRKLYAAHRRHAARSSTSPTERRRIHAARNAMIAIEGATYTLERHRDQLPEQDRARLSDAIATEIRRLQQLIEPEVSASAAADEAPLAVDPRSPRARGSR